MVYFSVSFLWCRKQFDKFGIFGREFAKFDTNISAFGQRSEQQFAHKFRTGVQQLGDESQRGGHRFTAFGHFHIECNVKHQPIRRNGYLLHLHLHQPILNQITNSNYHFSIFFQIQMMNSAYRVDSHDALAKIC